MVKKSLLFPVTRQDKALSQAYFNKPEPPKPETPKQIESAKLSDAELQSYIDLLLEASKPTESVDYTMQILLAKFPPQTQKQE